MYQEKFNWNAKYETAVLFSELSRHEGGQQLRAYLLMNKVTGKVIGNSGITIATGFDIGQHNEKEIKNFNFPLTLENKLLPFVNAKKEAAKALLPLAHQTIISTEEANQIDFAVKGDKLKRAIKSWNTNKSKNTPLFKDLTSVQQTVILSRSFHIGPELLKVKVAQPFYKAALKNDWVKAEMYLRSFNVREQWYKDRVRQEADLFNRERIFK